MLLLISFVLLLASAFPLYAATINATTCSYSDVSSAITSATSGDTVQVPSGTCTWTSALTVDKNIKLWGAGAGGFVDTKSRSSVTVGTGTKTFTVDSGVNFQNGETLQVVYINNNDDTMTGTVTSYSGTTLTMNITSTTGSGTDQNWMFIRPATTTITHGGTANLINVTEQTAGSVEVKGFYFNGGTSSVEGVMVNVIDAVGGKPVIVRNNRFTVTTGAGRGIESSSNRGVYAYNSFDNGFCAGQYAGCASRLSVAQGIAFKKSASNSAWLEASYMGTADTNGDKNSYLESNIFVGIWQSSFDVDDNARAVIRYNKFYDSSMGGSHGADTSPIGIRYMEIYNNTSIHTNLWDETPDPSFDMNWHIYNRGGTGVIADNTMNDINSSWGDKAEIVFAVQNLRRNQGPYPCWGASTAGVQYPAPHQIGRGYVTGEDQLEPLYMWSNSGFVPLLQDYTPNECGASADLIADYVQNGRDYYSATTKPSYTKYTYPHPLLADSGAPVISSLVCSPTSVQAPGTTDCTVTASNTPTSYAYSFTSCTAATCTTSDTDSVGTVSCQYAGSCTPCATATNASGTSAQYCGSAFTVKARKGSQVRPH